jgi:transposase
MDQVLECKQLSAAGHRIREIARKLGVSRNTVRAYLKGDREPGVYMLKVRRKQPIRDAMRPRVLALLEEEQRSCAPRKQRLTAARIHRILESEGIPGTGRIVSTLVRELKIELRDPLEHAYLPLEYEPGKDAQVDFFEAEVEDLDRGRIKTFVLLVRACYSARTFVYAAPNQTQESLMEGLMQAFAFFGGVFPRLWFDNLTPAVRKVLKGRDRIMQKSFERFCVHYGFRAEFCSPGKGNEKGGVEGAVKYGRHEIFSPIPHVRGRTEIQGLCNEYMTREDTRIAAGHSRSVGDRFADEVPNLLPLAEHRFLAGTIRTASVSKRSWVSHGTNVYSVPVSWVGRVVDLRADAEHVTLRLGQEEAVTHMRLHGRHEMCLKLEHYLPLLKRKHRGLDHAIPVKMWMRDASPCWHELLHTLRKRDGEVTGGCIFIDTLMMCETYGVDAMETAIKRALSHPEISVGTIRFYLWRCKETDQERPKSIEVKGPSVRATDPADYMILCQQGGHIHV